MIQLTVSRHMQKSPAWKLLRQFFFNTDKKAVERLRYYIERDAIICVLVRDVVDISMELNEIKAVMTLAAEHGISINAESRGYEPALISFE